MELCYSNNGEDWKDFDEAIQTPCEELDAGGLFLLAEGNMLRVPITKFVCALSLLEDMAGQAAHNYGEHAEQFAADIDACPDDIAELQNAIELVVQGWGEKHNKLPNFFDVKNVKWRQWRVVNPDEYEVEPR